MNIQGQVALRSKKLGVLIRDARHAAHLSLSECGQKVGVPGEVLRSWEEGRQAPSLPELEALAYSLRLPLQHFWGNESISEKAAPPENVNLPALINVRHRHIGALLRKQREDARLSLWALAEQSGISTARLNAYEIGERPVPLPELECLMRIMGGKFEAVFDRASCIGGWMVQQEAVQDFSKLPAELQRFVSQPESRPYLELAMRLSSMSAESLRRVAEVVSEKLSQYEKPIIQL